MDPRGHVRGIARGIGVWGALLALGVSPALGAPQSRGQRACVLALNKSGAAVAESQAGEALHCLEQAAKGKEPDPEKCLSADGRGKLARSRTRLAAGAAKRCRDPLPPFGYASPGAIGGHAVAEATALTGDVFGADLSAAASAATSPGAAACQSALAAGSEQVLAAFLQRARKVKGAALGDRQAPAEDAEALAQALAAALASGADAKLERAAQKLRARAGRECGGAALGALFPGACAGAADPDALAACTDARARCRACRALATFDLVPLDCDALDDALANQSCKTFELPFFPDLAASAPGEGEADVSPTRWLSLEFAAVALGGDPRRPRAPLRRRPSADPHAPGPGHDAVRGAHQGAPAGRLLRAPLAGYERLAGVRNGLRAVRGALRPHRPLPLCTVPRRRDSRGRPADGYGQAHRLRGPALPGAAAGGHPGHQRVPRAPRRVQPPAAPRPRALGAPRPVDHPHG